MNTLGSGFKPYFKPGLAKPGFISHEKSDLNHGNQTKTRFDQSSLNHGFTHLNSGLDQIWKLGPGSFPFIAIYQTVEIQFPAPC